MRALARKEHAPGLNDTSTLDAVNNLGDLYHDHGKLDKAEEMYVRALAGKEQELGLNHTSTLNMVHNLGFLYRKRGKLDEAEQMYCRGDTGHPRLWRPEAAVTERASLPRWPYICCAFGTAFLASDSLRQVGRSRQDCSYPLQCGLFGCLFILHIEHPFTPRHCIFLIF